MGSVRAFCLLRSPSDRLCISQPCAVQLILLTCIENNLAMNMESRSLRGSFAPSFGSDLPFWAPIFWLITEFRHLLAFQLQGAKWPDVNSWGSDCYFAKCDKTSFFSLYIIYIPGRAEIAATEATPFFLQL